MIKLGTNSIGSVYLGANSIGKAYLGSNLVYQKGSPTPPVPVIEPVFYDYLIFDGTAYIDTDIIPDANASFRVNLGDETLKAAQRLFGLPAGSGVFTSVAYNSNTTSTDRSFSVYYASSAALAYDKTLAFSSGRYNMFLTPKRFGWSTTIYTFTKGSGTPSGPLVIGSNASHSGQPYTGRIRYGFRVYGSDAQDATTPKDLLDNYTPTHTLLPCTYDGEAGLWCVETSKFYGNSAGSGQLTVANEE